MAKALISTKEKVQHIASWEQRTVPTDGDTVVDENTAKMWYPVWTDITNAQRVAEVAETEFAMHSDFLWVDCNSSVTADAYYYDTSDSTIKEITHATQPS